MKYIVVSALFLANNEILSLLALSVMSVMFLLDIVTAREEQRWN